MLEQALAPRPVYFAWREDAGGCLHLALIAQDVQRVLPDLVSAGAGGDVLSVDYARVGVVALGGVQELTSQVRALEARVAERDRQIEALLKRVAALESKGGK